jgi:M3 family oligoendopeptidase
MRFSEFPYERPSIEKITSEMSEFIKDFKMATSAEEQLTLVKKINNLRLEFDSVQTIAHVRHTLDTTDPFYEEEFEFFNKNYPKYTDAETQFFQALLESPFKSVLENALGKQFFIIAESKIKTFSPEVMDLLGEENRLTSEYQKLIASATVSFNGEDLTLSKIEKFVLDKDRDTRKRAMEAKYDYFSSKRDVLDELFDNLVKVRTEIATKLGFDSFTDLAYLRWARSGWDKESAATFRENVRKHLVPLISTLVESQRARLEIDKVMVYDEKIQFQGGNPVPQGDADWIVEQGRKLYSELSLETKDFYNEMTERGLFDLLNKKGKANIGYCTYFGKERVPFVFANFNGTANDVRVLIHEVGHAFQAHSTLKTQEILDYFFPTMEGSEIFSMSMEFFTFPWSELFFKEEADKHRFFHLVDALVKIPKMCVGDEFQEEVYANPDLTPEDRRVLWSKIELKYMPYRDNAGIPHLDAGGAWQEIPHIYEVPFYFLDYALAQVCAIQLWDKANEDWEHAWNTYVRLCKIGGSKSFTELLEEGQLQSPFEEQTFIDLKSFLSEKIESLKVPV